MALDNGHPRFSWTMVSEQRGEQQSAYRILVAGKPENLNRLVGDMWDSGRVAKESSTHILYAGKPLQSNQTCYWQVKVWNREGKPSGWSPVAEFSTALVNETDWKAQWIGAGPPGEPFPPAGFYQSKKEQYSLPDTIRHRGRSDLLRKEFLLTDKIRSARVFVSGLGYYELFINGQRVGDRLLSPAKTNYRKQVLYDTYDVSSHLQKGENAVGIHLGNGWFNPYKKWWQQYRMQWFGAKRAIFQMQVEYQNSLQETIVSDRSWKTATGPVMFSCVYDGEVYDAREEIEGWATPGFDDSGWKSVNEVAAPGGKLISQTMPPIQVDQTIHPVKVSNPKPGIFVFDMGQNFAGWTRLKVRGPVGTKIVQRFAEDILPNGMIDRTSMEQAGAQATYVLKGEGTEIYQPRFTFFGFRYVEVSGFPGTPTLENLEGWVVHSDCRPVGSFACDNELINRIHNATLWSQKSNLLGYPMDCPQRDERLGWFGDAQVTASEAMFNFDMALFYRKWLSGIRLNQAANGDIPIISPRPYIWDEGVEWSSSYLTIVWENFLFYGDTTILQQHYPAMKRYLEFLKSISNNFILKKGWIGDWGSMIEGWQEGDPELVPTAYYFYDATILAKIAHILYKPQDVAYFTELAGKIQQAFNQRFFHPESGNYCGGSQFANAFPLFIGIVKELYREKVLANLVEDIVARHDFHLTGGVLSAKYVIDTLTRLGRADVAYRIVTQSGYPGWAHMVEGRTTLSEFWNLKQSHNHVMMGSIDAWFYRTLAGIQPDESAPGFKKILIKPFVPDNMNFVQATVETLRGKILSGWKKQNGYLLLTLSVPVNSTAEVWIPCRLKGEVFEGGKNIQEMGRIRIVGEKEGKTVVTVPSGNYEFRVRNSE